MNYEYLEESEPEPDEISNLVSSLNITANATRIFLRPDVAVEEQELWAKQDPDYPPEHYECTLIYEDRTFTCYQTVGADYPDEDEELADQDLYADQRELLLSPEFLLETSALKANSVDEALDLEQWVKGEFVKTLTPEGAYASYKKLAADLRAFLGKDVYARVVELAVEAESEEEDD